MNNYYLIPTWLILIIATVTDSPVMRAIAFIMAGLQSIQLVLYSSDAWLLKRVKLIVFSIFSIGRRYDEEELTRIEEKYLSDAEDKYSDAINCLDQIIEAKETIVRRMQTAAEEECRVILQEANNKAAAIIYRAEEKVEQEVNARISEIKGKFSATINFHIDEEIEASEAVNLILRLAINIEEPICLDGLFIDEKTNSTLLEYVEETLCQVGSMSGDEFEFFCQNLLLMAGFVRVTVTKLSGDFGADILADRDFVSFAIQCKRYSANVGSDSVQQIYSAKEIYRKDIAVVITNSYFTEHAIKMANQMGVKLWDREILSKFLAIAFIRKMIE
jgi:restriction system protein